MNKDATGLKGVHPWVEQQWESLGFRPEGLTTIILPAEDVLKAAKQAPEAKGDAEKKEEPKKPKEEK
jgi:hypothetical protein